MAAVIILFVTSLFCLAITAYKTFNTNSKLLYFCPQKQNPMKKIVFLFIFALFALHSFSQDIDESTRKKFSIVVDLFTDIWVDVPPQVDVRTINQGVNVAGLYDYRFRKSNYSFAFGFGLGCHNFFSNSFSEVDSIGDSHLIPISTLYPGTSYKKNKISFSYFDIPIEFRLRTKDEFRASLGFKMGFLIDSHTKYKGDDYIFGTNDQIHVKFKDVYNIEKFRYGFTARFGWKYINVTAFYSLTGLYKKGKGPELYPISVGISLMPF